MVKRRGEVKSGGVGEAKGGRRGQRGEERPREGERGRGGIMRLNPKLKPCHALKRLDLAAMTSLYLPQYPLPARNPFSNDTNPSSITNYLGMHDDCLSAWVLGAEFISFINLRGQMEAVHQCALQLLRRLRHCLISWLRVEFS